MSGIDDSEKTIDEAADEAPSCEVVALTGNDDSVEETKEPVASFHCPVALATRRAHLSEAHLEALFGQEHVPTPLVSLPGKRIAYAEEVFVKGPQGSVSCRVVGPPPKHTRIYLRPKERSSLGIGDEDAAVLLQNSHGCTLEGPNGMLILAEGLLDVVRTLYLNPHDLKKRGLAVGSRVRMRINGERTRSFADVLVRTHPEMLDDPLPPLMMIDIDEANACELRPNSSAGYFQDA
ncbi:MAG: hypothetical protein GY822_05665 [Deltaproteobacteria bacterium]|nr:hypothetical protein [Deltaproteobacteria bacterium]